MTWNTTTAANWLYGVSIEKATAASNDWGFALHVKYPHVTIATDLKLRIVVTTQTARYHLRTKDINTYLVLKSISPKLLC